MGFFDNETIHYSHGKTQNVLYGLVIFVELFSIVHCQFFRNLDEKRMNLMVKNTKIVILNRE